MAAYRNNAGKGEKKKKKKKVPATLGKSRADARRAVATASNLVSRLFSLFSGEKI